MVLSVQAMLAIRIEDLLLSIQTAGCLVLHRYIQKRYPSINTARLCTQGELAHGEVRGLLGGLHSLQRSLQERGGLHHRKRVVRQVCTDESNAGVDSSGSQLTYLLGRQPPADCTGLLLAQLLRDVLLALNLLPHLIASLLVQHSQHTSNVLAHNADLGQLVCSAIRDLSDAQGRQLLLQLGNLGLQLLDGLALELGSLDLTHFVDSKKLQEERRAQELMS